MVLTHSLNEISSKFAPVTGQHRISPHKMPCPPPRPRLTRVTIPAICISQCMGEQPPPGPAAAARLLKFNLRNFVLAPSYQKAFINIKICLGTGLTDEYALHFHASKKVKNGRESTMLIPQECCSSRVLFRHERDEHRYRPCAPRIESQDVLHPFPSSFPHLNVCLALKRKGISGFGKAIRNDIAETVSLSLSLSARHVRVPPVSTTNRAIDAVGFVCPFLGVIQYSPAFGGEW